MRVALVTWKELPGLSDDDRELIAPLARRGIAVVPAVWNDPAVRWSEFDASVVRSTWDYYRHPAEFLAWTHTVGATGRLWNPGDVLRWNSHKSYLRDLAARGVPVVPTRFCPDLDSALAVLRRENWPRAVLKAAVSAGGFRTYLVDRSALTSGKPPWIDAPPIGELMVQPYEEEVERSGERSLVFFQGSYSHAFVRAPKLAPGSPLVEGAPTRPTPGQLEIARRTVSAAPAPTLYARVDLVAGADGEAKVMELEVIEPALELRTAPGAAERFAEAIASVAGRNAQIDGT